MINRLFRALGLFRSRSPSRELDEFVAAVAPVLGNMGYTFGNVESGSSSPGEFASGYFNGPAGRIGLLMRAGQGLGSIGYASESGACTHDDLMRAVGAIDDAWLSFGRDDWRPRVRRGESVAAALAHDLDVHARGVLIAPPENLDRIVRAALGLP